MLAAVIGAPRAKRHPSLDRLSVQILMVGVGPAAPVVVVLVPLTGIVCAFIPAATVSSCSGVSWTGASSFSPTDFSVSDFVICPTPEARRRDNPLRLPRDDAITDRMNYHDFHP